MARSTRGSGCSRSCSFGRPRRPGARRGPRSEWRLALDVRLGSLERGLADVQAGAAALQSEVRGTSRVCGDVAGRVDILCEATTEISEKQERALEVLGSSLEYLNERLREATVERRDSRAACPAEGCVGHVGAEALAEHRATLNLRMDCMEKLIRRPPRSACAP